ncbi:MAG: hypothetical protein O7D91_01305 [Planctomycetota bacterium]|nr:hypothetical protein [Planctomycetota bacterium]
MFAEWLFGDRLPTWAIFVELLLCGLIISVAGARLTRLADRISDILNLGKAWVGLLLLAGITSLPEVVTGGTAVTIGQPNLAFGNIFGSCMFNVAIIVILDGLMRSGTVLRVANPSHSLSSSMGIVLIALAVLGMTLVQQAADAESPVSPEVMEAVLCVLLAGAYVACMRLSFRFEQQLQNGEQIALAKTADQQVRRIYISFAILSVILIIVTIWLTRTADVLQDHPIGLLGGRTLGATFVGVFFLAAATSLPEIVTSITAVRIGQVDLALGNIFGSNMFNIAVIPMLKVFSLLNGQTMLMDPTNFAVQGHTIAGLFAILITGVAVAGLVYRTKRRLFHFGIDSVLIGVIYLVGMYILLR